MKNVKLSLFIVFLLSLTANAYGQNKKETFMVYGNCGQCEKHIEKAAKQAGAQTAKWDMDSKMLALSYDSTKVSTDKIQRKIADAGYDTPLYAGDDKAYNKLDACCQYDRKKSDK